MTNKAQFISALRDQFNQWETLLTNLNEEQVTAPGFISKLSIKDMVAHLYAWQQVSIARMEAALSEHEPQLPQWLGSLPPESDEYLDRFNERIFRLHREQPWSNVHQLWKEGFLHFLELAEQTPEPDLLAEGRYPWLAEYPLSAVLIGSREHHQEHLEELQSRLNQNQQGKNPK